MIDRDLTKTKFSKILWWVSDRGWTQLAGRRWKRCVDHMMTWHDNMTSVRLHIATVNRYAAPFVFKNILITSLSPSYVFDRGTFTVVLTAEKRLWKKMISFSDDVRRKIIFEWRCHKKKIINGGIIAKENRWV